MESEIKGRGSSIAKEAPPAQTKETEIPVEEDERESEDEPEEEDDGHKEEGEHVESKMDEQEEARTIYQIQISHLRERFVPPVDQVIIPLRGTILETQLTEQDIEGFGEAFEESPTHSMDLKEFQENLKTIAHVFLPPNELRTLFLKMDADKDGQVTWNEFLSYIMLEMKDKDGTDDREELHPPLSGYPRMLKTNHRLPVIKITFLPILLADRSVSFLKGRYVTASRDGMIHYWTLDFEMVATHYSESPERKIRPTWITDMVCIPDVNVICTSSTERDLRFYDVTGHKFDLRIMITRLDFPVTCMYYSFPKEITRDSKLVAGTMSGSVLVFSFSSVNKGPFHYTPGKYLTIIRYHKVLKGMLPDMRVTEFNRVHCDWVKQVGYYSNMNSFLSCAADSENSLIMVDSQNNKFVFTTPKGIMCFTIDETNHILVTGGVDCSVRVWNIFVPHKPSCIFVGHHAPIVAVVTQDAGRRVYSLSKDKCIKVWDVPSQKCIQTYISMPQEVGSSGLATLYNPSNRNLMVGCSKMAILVLGVVVDTERSDGFTHSMAVVRALYNPLFKCVVTVGLDSLIMVWDPWEGKRMVLVRNAHTRSYYGDPTAVEITAATFDPGYQLLLTGARDGTLKVWNFNTGTCVRTMNIELYCEVTNVIWLTGRILAVGWNRHVTEYSDESIFSDAKVWETRHTDDVLCAAACGEQALATSSYNGELVLWRLETGQAYRRYSVVAPKSRIILTYTSGEKQKAGSSILTAGTVEGIKRTSTTQKKIQSIYEVRKGTAESKIDPSMPKGQVGEMKDIVVGGGTTERRKSDTVRPGSVAAVRRMSLQASRSGSLPDRGALGQMLARRSSSAATPPGSLRKTRRVSIVRMPSPMRKVAVTAMLFLESRPMKADVGTLLLAIDKGLIQLWSHHTAGGCVANFLSIHMAGDYVCCMATDPDNKYLFTGTSLGYIKVWLMENYGFPDCEKVKICMPALRLEFPFLWHDRVEGRAKRSLRDQKWPLLVNSYRGHLLAIHQIETLHEYKIVMTGSSDATARLWTLGGRYIGTLGSVVEWHRVQPTEDGERVQYRIPPDVGLVASSTTLKVLKGGEVPRTHYKMVDDSELLRDLPERLVAKATYGKRASSPVLGHHYRLPKNELTEQRFRIKDCGPTVPVYCHLRCAEMEEIKRPPTPESITRKLERERNEAQMRRGSGERGSACERRGSGERSSASERRGSSRNSVSSAHNGASPRVSLPETAPSGAGDDD